MLIARGTAVAAALMAAQVFADTIELEPVKDNTLYQSTSGSLSNGSGSYLFVGTTAGSETRRCVLEFDIAGAIPAGSTITSAQLVLTMSRSIAGLTDVSLHRCLQEWGEGASDAGGEEGGGAPALDGDATWIHAVYHPAGGSVLWSNVGGDYEPGSSAVTSVGGVGAYSWSTGATAADVQAWLDDPASNHGWILLGDEETAASSKRFDAREFTVASDRPRLVIEFTPPAGCPADINGDTVLDFFDVQEFLSLFSAMDPAADFNNDTVFDFFDVQAFLQAFSAGCG